MKTLKKVEIIPVFVEFMPNNYEDNHVYITLKYKSSTHKCLCGCGNLSILNLNEKNEHSWRLTVNSSNKITFYPSILNTFCLSHYIITNNVANFV